MQRKSIVRWGKNTILVGIVLAILIPSYFFIHEQIFVLGKSYPVTMTLVHKHIDQDKYGTNHIFTFTSDKWGGRYEMLVTSEYYNSVGLGHQRSGEYHQLQFVNHGHGLYNIAGFLFMIYCIIGFAILIWRIVILIQWINTKLNNWAEKDECVSNQ